MSATKHTPKPGEVVVVPHIPPCDFCSVNPYEPDKRELGPYDFRTRMGPWAHGCEQHWLLYRASMNLGVGAGQLWITKDQVAS